MRLTDRLHLTYCLNVHPGESWEEQFRAIREHAAPLAARVAGDRPFGLGLRLSAASAAYLAQRPAALEAVGRELADRRLYALTVNAFPFGRFHGTRVKDDVYRPAWDEPGRLDYTRDAARVLAALLPDGVPGSLSTAPLGYKGWPDWEARIATALLRFADAGRAIRRIADETGRSLVLALEPEPCCFPETIAELCAVFARLPADVRALGTLGCCCDTAHQAVAFEPPDEALACLRDAGIPIGKIQLSAAIGAATSMEAREALRPFVDPVYLHQAALRAPDGTIRRYHDLDRLLADPAAWAPGGEVRVHFHVPLFVERFGPLRSTADLLAEPNFLKLAGAGIASTLEIETYTWSVWLGATGGSDDIDAGIAREFAWVQARLAPSAALAAPRPPALRD